MLKSLLGGDEGIGKLSTFLSLPAEHAAVQFATDCLLPPSTVLVTGDGQSKLLTDALVPELGRQPLRVLDWGAGQCRLLQALRESYVQADGTLPLPKALDYFAFDRNGDDRDPCCRTIEDVYGQNKQRYFSAEDSMKAALDRESVRIVVMCNVLHEVDPKVCISHATRLCPSCSRARGAVRASGHNHLHSHRPRQPNRRPSIPVRHLHRLVANLCLATSLKHWSQLGCE